MAGVLAYSSDAAMARSIGPRLANRLTSLAIGIGLVSATYLTWEEWGFWRGYHIPPASEWGLVWPHPWRQVKIPLLLPALVLFSASALRFRVTGRGRRFFVATAIALTTIAALDVWALLMETIELWRSGDSGAADWFAAFLGPAASAGVVPLLVWAGLGRFTLPWLPGAGDRRRPLALVASVVAIAYGVARAFGLLDVEVFLGLIDPSQAGDVLALVARTTQGAGAAILAIAAGAALCRAEWGRRLTVAACWFLVGSMVLLTVVGRTRHDAETLIDFKVERIGDLIELGGFLADQIVLPLAVAFVLTRPGVDSGNKAALPDAVTTAALPPKRNNDEGARESAVPDRTRTGCRQCGRTPPPPG